MRRVATGQPIWARPTHAPRRTIADQPRQARQQAGRDDGLFACCTFRLKAVHRSIFVSGAAIVQSGVKSNKWAQGHAFTLVARILLCGWNIFSRGSTRITARQPARRCVCRCSQWCTAEGRARAAACAARRREAGRAKRMRHEREAEATRQRRKGSARPSALVPPQPATRRHHPSSALSVALSKHPSAARHAIRVLSTSFLFLPSITRRRDRRDRQPVTSLPR